MNNDLVSGIISKQFMFIAVELTVIETIISI